MPDSAVSLILRRKNPLHLHQLGGRILSHEEFNETYAAHATDFTELAAFALEHGLAVDMAASSLARRTIVVRGNEEAIRSAFATTIPREHADKIVAVLGLDPRPIAKPHFRVHSQVQEDGYTPLEIAKLYNFPEGDGAGQTIGILELGGGYQDSDVATFFGALTIPAPTVVAVSVDGASNAPGDPSGADGEVALDIQVAGAVARGAKIAVYFAPNTDQGFIDALTTAVHDQVHRPSVISISWGGPESSWSTAALTALDDACQSAGALGVTITVASGDNGSSDGGSGDNVDFPASSPHVLACGGTALGGSYVHAEGAAPIASEVTWNDQPSGGGATGGGYSAAFPVPAWQRLQGASGRGVPDVAGDAAPETGYSVLVDGSWQTVGGTSAVAPLWAGLLAIINQQRAAAGKPPAGFVNPGLYANPTALRDITVGNNGSFAAGPGWDACTGLGSPNGAAVAAALK